MIKLPCDDIKNSDMFLLYAKRFIPFVFEYATEICDRHMCKDINGNNDRIGLILRVTCGTDLYAFMNMEPKTLSSYQWLLTATTHHIIEHRHLDEYWVQSELMKEL